MTLLSRLKKIVRIVFHAGGAVPYVIRVVLTVLFLVIVNRSLTLDDVSDMILNVSPFCLIICIVLSIASILLQALRWFAVMWFYDVKCSFKLALKTLLWGNVLAFITPGRVGELFRGIEICPSGKISTILAATADRIFSIATVILFAIPAMLVQWFYWHRALPFYFTILFIACTVCLIGVILILLFPKWLRHLPAVLFIKINLIVTPLRKMDFVSVTLLSAAIHGLLILQTMLLFGSFGMERWFENCVIALLSYAFMLCIPVFIANIGIREYAFALFAGKVYTDASLSLSLSASAFGVSGMILLINIIFPALAGLFWNYIPVRSQNLKETAVTE